jgi:hypothetical protein
MKIANVGVELLPQGHWPDPTSNLDLEIQSVGSGTEFELGPGHWLLGAETLASVTVNLISGQGLGSAPARLPFGYWWYHYVPPGETRYAVIKSLVGTVRGFANKIDGIRPIPAPK